MGRSSHGLCSYALWSCTSPAVSALPCGRVVSAIDCDDDPPVVLDTALWVADGKRCTAPSSITTQGHREGGDVVPKVVHTRGAHAGHRTGSWVRPAALRAEDLAKRSTG
jgi:hypothetical protein